MTVLEYSREEFKRDLEEILQDFRRPPKNGVLRDFAQILAALALVSAAIFWGGRADQLHETLVQQANDRELRIRVLEREITRNVPYEVPKHR